MTTRIYCPLLSPGYFSLAEPQAQHVRVLRLKGGESLILFDGKGQLAQAEIIQLDKKKVEVKVEKIDAAVPTETYPVHLFQALIRPDKMDWIIQKSVELGVKSITPILCERTQGRLSTQQIQKKSEHWNEIIISSAEQCGLNFLPVLHPPLSFEKMIPALPVESSGVFILSPVAPTSFSEIKCPQAGAALVIGPEGGFSAEELTWAAHLQAIRLHENVLRSETAAIVALALCQAYAQF